MTGTTTVNKTNETGGNLLSSSTSISEEIAATSAGLAAVVSTSSNSSFVGARNNSHDNSHNSYNMINTRGMDSLAALAATANHLSNHTTNGNRNDDPYGYNESTSSSSENNNNNNISASFNYHSVPQHRQRLSLSTIQTSSTSLMTGDPNIRGMMNVPYRSAVGNSHNSALHFNGGRRRSHPLPSGLSALIQAATSQLGHLADVACARAQQASSTLQQQQQQQSQPLTSSGENQSLYNNKSAAEDDHQKRSGTTTTTGTTVMGMGVTTSSTYASRQQGTSVSASTTNTNAAQQSFQRGLVESRMGQLHQQQNDRQYYEERNHLSVSASSPPIEKNTTPPIMPEPEPQPQPGTTPQNAVVGQVVQLPLQPSQHLHHQQQQQPNLLQQQQQQKYQHHQQQQQHHQQQMHHHQDQTSSVSSVPAHFMLGTTHQTNTNRTPAAISVFPQKNHSSPLLQLRFPEILMKLACQPHNINVITFLPDDKFFAIHVPKFVEIHLQKYHSFDSMMILEQQQQQQQQQPMNETSSIESIQQQPLRTFVDFLRIMHTYGFQTITESNLHSHNGNNNCTNHDIVVFRHPYFVKGDWVKCHSIRWGSHHQSYGRSNSAPFPNRGDGFIHDHRNQISSNQPQQQPYVQQPPSSNQHHQKQKVDNDKDDDDLVLDDAIHTSMNSTNSKRRLSPGFLSKRDDTDTTTSAVSQKQKVEVGELSIDDEEHIVEKSIKTFEEQEDLKEDEHHNDLTVVDNDEHKQNICIRCGTEQMHSSQPNRVGVGEHQGKNEDTRVASYGGGGNRFDSSSNTASDNLRSIASAITSEKLNIRQGNSSTTVSRHANSNVDHDAENDNEYYHKTTTTSQHQHQPSLVDQALTSMTHTIVTDAITSLLRDIAHTKTTYLKYEEELSTSIIPGVIPISKQLFAPSTTGDSTTLTAAAVVPVIVTAPTATLLPTIALPRTSATTTTSIATVTTNVPGTMTSTTTTGVATTGSTEVLDQKDDNAEKNSSEDGK